MVALPFYKVFWLLQSFRLRYHGRDISVGGIMDRCGYPTMSSNSLPRVSWTILSTKTIEMKAQAA